MATTHVDPFVAGLDAFQAVRRDLLKRAAGAVWVRGSMAAEDLRSAGGCTGVARVPALHHLLASDRETQRKERDMPLKEYKPGQAFNGRIGRTIAESEPAWPEPQRAKQSAPSVLFIVLDDTGYGQLGCYGGLSETPNLDRLAGNGLLYTNNLTPAEQTSAAGPYDRWPLGRGFERYYGFLGGDTHQYYPDLVADNRQVVPPRTPDEGYHLTEDLVDKAISFVADAKQVAPTKPFFLYFATGSMHAPHHVPREWADHYKGKFDFVPESLEDNLRAIDDLGGPRYFNHYPWGWTWAGDTPFRRWKRETFRGGVTDPFLVHWPAGIRARGKIRRQYAHAIDMVPTVLDALGIDPPSHIRGVSQSPITAEVEIPEGGANGVLLAHGGNTGGYSFFVQSGKLHYVYNYVAAKEFHVESRDTIPTGRHTLRLEFERTGEADPRQGKGAPGHVRLLVDGWVVGEGDIPVTIPLLIGLGGGLICGRSSASPITDAYQPPFAFTGVLEEVRLEIGREALVRDEEAELRMAMGRE